MNKAINTSLAARDKWEKTPQDERCVKDLMPGNLIVL